MNYCQYQSKEGEQKDEITVSNYLSVGLVDQYISYNKLSFGVINIQNYHIKDYMPFRSYSHIMLKQRIPYDYRGHAK